MNYLRARYYDPATGGFAARDRLSAMTRQPYIYVHDSPLNGSDPSGDWCAAVNLSASFISGWDTGGGPGGAATASLALGVCDNGDVFAAPSVGAAAYDQYGNYACYPTCNSRPTIAGHYASYGAGVMASPDATSATQLGGPFQTSCGGFGVGEKVGEGSIATGGGVTELTYSGFPYPGIGVGAGGAQLQTNTFGPATYNWVQHLVNDPLVGAASAIGAGRRWL